MYYRQAEEKGEGAFWFSLGMEMERNKGRVQKEKSRGVG